MKETSLTKFEKTLVYECKHNYLEDNQSTQILRKNNSMFYTCAYEFLSQGLLTKIAELGMKFPSMEQVSNKIRKELPYLVVPLFSQ